jgi:hypothetical protein
LIIVILVPGYFYSELYKEARDKGGVSTENRRIFYEHIDYDMMNKKVPGVLGQGEEFVDMKVRSQ